MPAATACVFWVRGHLTDKTGRHRDGQADWLAVHADYTWRQSVVRSAFIDLLAATSIQHNQQSTHPEEHKKPYTVTLSIVTMYRNKLTLPKR
jgi:hypothetical protein